MTYSKKSENVAKFPSQPFEGYSEVTGDSVVEAFRKTGFDLLPEDEAAYKVLLIDAHHLYFGFIKCFPNSIHIPEMAKQLSRFRYYKTDEEDQNTSGTINFTLQDKIPFSELLSDFHWNNQFTRTFWTLSPIIWANGNPVRATVAMGNLQWKGTAIIEGRYLKLYKGTTLIYPSVAMSTETKKYRDMAGMKAGYIPNPSVIEKAEELVAMAQSHMAKNSDRDKVEEIKLWTRAAAMGSAPAQVQVAVAIVNGEWLTSDPIEAGRLLLCAASVGDKSAKNILQKVSAEKDKNVVLAEIQDYVDATHSSTIEPLSNATSK